MATLLASPLTGQTVTYDRAVVDSVGRLFLRTTGGPEAAVPLDSGQVGFDQARIAPDARAVGWLALYPNCCTSYPIPLTLVVLTGRGRQSFTGAGLPIWRWAFLAGGTRVAYYQETVHGGAGQHYELRALPSGRLVATHDPGQPHPPPDWVLELDARR